MNGTARPRTLIAAACLAGVLALAACSSSGSSTATQPRRPAMGGMTTDMSGGMPGASGPTATSGLASSAAPASGSHNNADVSFATDMIPHHAQAVTMADMALRLATTPAVRTLATTIKAAQSPEIMKMSGWLKGWDRPVPATTYTIGSMGGMSMTGMMSDDDMKRLNAARGVSFDRMWLTMMITHHNGAIAMAKTELAQGDNPDAKALATSISTSQSAQITQMRWMIRHLPR